VASACSIYWSFIPYPFLPQPPSVYFVSNIITGPTYQAWFAPAFLAMRGGFRFKVFRHQADLTAPGNQYPQNSYQRVNTSRVDFSSYRPFIQQSYQDSVLTQRDVDLTAASSYGAAVTTSYIHTGSEFEMPYLLPERFANPRKITGLFNPSAGKLEVPSFFFEHQATASRFDIYSAAADDFSLHYFMYVPEHKFQAQYT